MKSTMTITVQSLNQSHEPAPAKDWRSRPVTRVLVGLLGWWSCGLSYAAVDFPSLPLQTGVVQPAPNIIFILDDSLSMAGDVLDTRLTWCNTTTCPNQPSLGSGTGAPYTKNPLSYNPATTYQAWATSNTTDTAVERLADASFTAASDHDYLITGSTNLSSSTQTYYVPKPSATLTDPRQYYRYQIRSSGNQLVRAEWSNTNNNPASATFTSATVNAGNWSNGGGTGTVSTSGSQTYTVPAGVTQLTITTSGTLGTNRNPGIYVNVGSNPSRTAPNFSANSNGNNQHETLTIPNPTVGATYRIGVFNHGSSNINSTMTITVTATSGETALGCSTSSSSYGWKNCTDITSTGDATTGVRALAAEKQNYANWYQYHRTRMKVAKAGGSEAFATLDENFRVGIMGLYPSGGNQQVIGGSDGAAAPTTSAPGNLNNIIPVDTNGGLFIGNNRKNWFDHLHDMQGTYATPLRKALDGAGKYYSTSRAYRATVDGDTTYLACRQNFTILTTDGYWNNFGGSDDPDSNYSGNNIRGDEEDGSVITGPNNQTYQYERAAPYWYNIDGSDRNDTTTLADVAMHYWKTDLRTTDVSGYAGSAENRVPSSVTNPAFWQHMVTFGVGLGVRGQLTDAQAAIAVAGTGTSGNGGFWPAPVHATNANDNPANVDDLRHAALNARGSYINANDADEFSRGITDALTRIGERRGSASNVLANSTSISTESFVYQATYTAGSWRGEVLAYPISSAGLGDPQWRAGERIPAWGSRNIFTSGGTFPTAGQLSDLSAEATDLGLATGTALADYLKGDASRERRNGGVLRDRVMRNTSDQIVPALLGDIVDSTPFYVADTRTVYVGANDGMLHAIDASNTSSGGTEQFTYIPAGLAMSDLADLADPLYGTNTSTTPHRYFVDGPIVVSSRARTPGRNFLVGALGRGGRGVYGLDVTNPASFGAGNVLWDNTGAAAPANMGNVISEPLISKLNSGVTAAVVANGPNSTSGTASLFFINLETGATIRELNTGTTNNGLSAPRAVDVNADGLVDYFFAGDLNGQLWRFDVTSTTAASWTATAVFTARDAANNPQPITSAPGAARDPATSNVWIFFGTGSYMTSDDQSSTLTQSYYGITFGPNGDESGSLTRSDLQERAINVVESSTGRRAFLPSESGIADGSRGWYIDLDNPSGTGERVISAPLLYDNILIFSSIVPPQASTVNSCEAGGSGYVNALDAFSGTSLDTPFFNESVLTITDGDGNELPIGSLPIGAGMPTAPIIVGDKLVIGDSSGGTPTDIDVSAPGGSSTRRVSWREVFTD
jgi:type IV pilus assembly protein PilY1